MSMTSGSPAIEARGLTKRFGEVLALNGLDLVVESGTVLGLLGPNGAGKTTAVSILTTLLQPDSGSATIAGVDLVAEPHRVRERIGLSGQYAAVDNLLTGRENLEIVGRLYQLPKAVAKQRADEALERLSLTEAGDRQVRTYSGGMRRRLDLGASLVGRPKVLILDEPTTGLDPRTRIELWEFLRELVGEGTTVLLTTQYLEEADELADQISVIDSGKLIAEGTSDELKQQMGGDVLVVTPVDRDAVAKAAEIITSITGSEARVNTVGEISTPVSNKVETLVNVAAALDDAALELAEIAVQRPSLDDVFLSLTGNESE